MRSRARRLLCVVSGRDPPEARCEPREAPAPRAGGVLVVEGPSGQNTEERS
jgi:hypothetical protein